MTIFGHAAGLPSVREMHESTGTTDDANDRHSVSVRHDDIMLAWERGEGTHGQQHCHGVKC